MPWRPRMSAPVGKSGPLTNSIRSSGVASGCSSRWTVASMTSPRLWGGMLVAIPTAMPWEPLTSMLGNRDGQDRRLLGGGVVVGDEVDRLLVDARHQLEGQRAQPALGVAHGRRTLVGAGAPEVAVTVDQRVAHGELLDHAGQRLVDGRVAVGVVGAHDVPDHLGALGVGSVGQQPLVVHRVEDPAVDRLQAVPHVGQGPRDDDRHRVLEEGALHLLLDLDGLDEPRDVLVGVRSPGPSLSRPGMRCPSPSHSSRRRPVRLATGNGPHGLLRCRGTARPWRWSG